VTTKAQLISAKTRERLDRLFERFPRKPDALLTALFMVQEDCERHLPSEVLDELAAIMEMPKSIIYEVVTFYHLYSTEPRGKNIILICQNLCCYLRGSDEIYRAVREELGIGPGETTGDGCFTLETAECLAACERAPAMMVNEETFGPLDPDGVKEILRKY
jgi:NADH-quinone oxidoreductase subunit E